MNARLSQILLGEVLRPVLPWKSAPHPQPPRCCWIRAGRGQSGPWEGDWEVAIIAQRWDGWTREGVAGSEGALHMEMTELLHRPGSES